MKAPVSPRCHGIGLTFTIIVSVVSIMTIKGSALAQPAAKSSSTALANDTRLNASYYWTEDRPYKHQPHYKKLPDGSVVPSNKTIFNSSDDYRGEVANQTPWVAQWVLSKQGRRTLKKDIPQLLMYNLVSPMDHGNSLRSSNVRRRRNKAARMFLTDNLALPLLKTLGHVAWNLIDSHYVGYFEDEIFAQRLKMMNASEMIEAFNLTPPADNSWADDDEDAVYATLIHFYAYPSVDKRMITPGKQVANDTEAAFDCTVERQCLVESGVTVYTPSLTNLTLFKTLADAGVSPQTKRSARLEALQEITKLAFDAERRALNHGLQAPSTIWYSLHDLDTDEFADAVLGTVNISQGDSVDTAPLHVFESLMKAKVPILDDVVSYYADTNHDTTIAMMSNHSMPMLDKFEGNELLKLIGLMGDEMKELSRAIDIYVHTRAADPQYQEIVNATMRGDFYNGSEYTLIGFGFVMPATNDKNVLYHDMKLPAPFHLVIRLIIRFQESRLLLPEESRQLLVCLAMTLNNISFYRCRSAASSSSHH
ncbi:hypothetical protein JM18_005867 [Phytophthora kernoviae]|uniref:Uncharacterized protein n=1 Tax=Phytophthora kernoviae TaxID=325452 RepID=A0A921V5Y3_9STRA|nr:hypothetical protein JM18_005867 [Phytophthora kernoviae]